MIKKFLVFQHVAHEHPGLIKKWADEKGVILEIVEFWKPYKIPDVLVYDGLIIMGGPMGVYDNYPSEKDELQVIKKALGKVSIIGFCLGSQLLAHALGAKVYPNFASGKRVKEIGFYEVELTDYGISDTILQGFTSSLKVLNWHGDAFDLPSGAKLLASNSNCTNQAFVYGNNAYGFLFHFEFTPEMIENQIKVDKDWIHTDFEMDEEKLKRESLENANLMEEQCNKLFNNFLSLVKNV